MNTLFKNDEIYNLFKLKLEKLDFNYIIKYTSNNNEMIFASKNKYDYYLINMNNIYNNIEKEITEDKYLEIYKKSITDNKNIFINIDNIKLSCIFLKKPIYHKNEYFDYINDINIKNKLNKINTSTQINELDRIIYEKPNIIIGNFNFTLYDDNNNLNNQVKKLTLNNYLNYNNILEEYSTINKRIDHTYSNIKVNINNIIKCNYSYNLPILQNINI